MSTFAALVAVCSLIAVPVAAVPVPITLQTFAVLLTGLVLGPWRGAVAVLLYLVVGLVGVPVFAGGAAGFAVVQGPSAGYLLAFPAAALVAGAWLRLAQRRRWPLVALHAAVAVTLATLVVYAAGVPVMAARTSLDLGAAWAYNGAFVPFDGIKAAVAVVVALAVFRAFPQLARR